MWLTTASGTPHPSPQIGPQGPFLSSRTSTRPQNNRFDLVALFSKNQFNKNFWRQNPPKLDKNSRFCTFTFIAASEKPDFEVKVDIGLGPFRSSSWWRSCGKGFGFTLHPGGLGPLTIMITPTIKPECRINFQCFILDGKISSILFMKLKIPTYFQFDLLLAFWSSPCVW